MPISLAALLLVALAFFGGASRPDALSQSVVRFFAILLGAASLLLPWGGVLRPFRWPVSLLGAFALLIILQLVPLPPSLWAHLPGRALFAHIVTLADVDRSWRPISIDPDLTINSLLALVVPASVFFIFARVSRDNWFALLCMVLALICMSALFGVGQISGRMNGLYLYRVTNPDSAVGLFANRNHQAVLLSLALPIFGAFTAFPLIRERPFDPRPAIGIMVGLFLAPLVLVTGSRSGLLLMLFGASAAWAIYRSGPVRSSYIADPRLKHRRSAASRRIQLGAILGLGAVALLLAITVLLAKAEALSRIMKLDLAQEQRATLLDLMLQILLKYFPVGAGFGTFDPLFRIEEPFTNLGPKYLNHAHNDWIEIVIEGGVPALLLLFAFLFWFARRAVRYWIGRTRGQSRAELLGRLGVVLIIMLGFASLWDYPLRTPTMAALFALSCCFICLEPRASTGKRRTVDGDPGAA